MKEEIKIGYCEDETPLKIYIDKKNSSIEIHDFDRKRLSIGLGLFLDIAEAVHQNLKLESKEKK